MSISLAFLAGTFASWMVYQIAHNNAGLAVVDALTCVADLAIAIWLARRPNA